MVAVEARGRRTLAVDLAELRRGCWAFEVAHKRDMEHYETITRILGYVVVALTAITGTTVVTALAVSTGTAARIVVGIVSVFTAVVAALNEKGPFASQQKVHADAATSFNKLHREAVVLHREWSRGLIDDDRTDRWLTDLEGAYDHLEATTIGVRHYVDAREWADRHEPADEMLAVRRGRVRAASGAEPCRGRHARR